MFRFRSFAPEPGVVRPQNKETTNHDSNPNPFHYLVGFELKRLSSRYNQLCFLYIVRTQMHFFIDLIIVDWDPRPQHHLAAAFSDIQSSNINQLNPKFSQSPILEISKFWSFTWFHPFSPGNLWILQPFPQPRSTLPPLGRMATTTECPVAGRMAISSCWARSSLKLPRVSCRCFLSWLNVYHDVNMHILYIYIYTISNEYEIVAVSPCRLPPVPQWPPFCGLKMKPLGVFLSTKWNPMPPAITQAVYKMWASRGPSKEGNFTKTALQNEGPCPLAWTKNHPYTTKQ